MPATVIVRGTAVTYTQPDEVTLTIVIGYRDRAAANALATVAERSTELNAILDDLAIAPERRTTTGATVSEATEWDETSRKQVHRGYDATNRIQLRLNDPAPIGKLMSDAVARSGATIQGPNWSIALDNPARLEACRLAAQNAQARADAYATALGARLGVIISIAEPGLSYEPVERPMKAYAMARTMSDAPELEVSAGEMAIQASVVVTYAVEQG
ncbi:MAG: SIMPL domain-containing protein [Thermomicrobiales bacterium]|nr:SIMPL domain-containing protein [Thermomicrobiales bacterium]